MENLIKEVFNKKLNDGTIEKIVSEKIDEMIRSILRDQMDWSGEVKKSLEARLKPIMLQAVSKCDLSQTAAVVTDLLNKAVKTSPVHLIKDTYDGIKTLFATDEETQDISFGKKVKLSDIFQFYTKTLSYPTYEKSDLEKKDIEVNYDYDDGKEYAYIGATMEVEDISKENYWGKYKTKYQVTLSNNFDDKDCVFEISQSYDDTFRINIDTGNMLLAELRHLPKIILYLIQLESNWCEIQIDTESELDEVQVEVD